MRPTLFRCALPAAVLMLSACGSLSTRAPATRLEVDTSLGCRFDIQLRPDLAPNHVQRVVTLSRKKFYDGVVFHRVIEGFMAQTGDPTGSGEGGSDLPDLAAEFTPTEYGRGVVGMARESNPDSGNSQFFILFTRKPHLDGKYTVWGTVDETGMQCVDRIARGEPPAHPDRMLKVRAR